MNAGEPRRRWRLAVGPTVPVLAALSLLAAYGSELPLVVGLAVASAGVALGVLLRGIDRAGARATFPVPVLVALGATAVFAGVAPLELLVVGLAGAAFVAWLTDEPSRAPRAVGRGALEWLVPTLGVALAWASSFLLPRTTASLGVAGGLTAGALALLAYLLTRPDLFDRDAAATI